MTKVYVLFEYSTSFFNSSCNDKEIIGIYKTKKEADDIRKKQDHPVFFEIEENYLHD